MSTETHHRKLERMYLSAPINKAFKPRIEVSEGAAHIEIDLQPSMHHAAGAVHGSVYFKMLDDAAFFAANSLEPDVFVLTTAFTTYLTRPVSSGGMRASGRVVNANRSQFIAEAVVCNDAGQEIGRGSGLFVRSRIRLDDTPGYA